MEDKTKRVLDFISKWHVTTKVIPHDKFIKMTKTGELDSVKLKDDSQLLTEETDLLRGLKYVGNEKFDNVIYFSDKYVGNYESALLHELAHILLKVKPSKIDEFKSPLTILWYNFCLFTKTKSKLIDEEGKKYLIFHVNKHSELNNFNSFNEYLNYHNEILIKIGLLDKNLNPTFYYMDGLPDLSWSSRLTIKY